MLSIITAMIAAQMKMAAMQAQIEALEARPPEVVTEYVTEYVYVPYTVTEYVTEYIETPGETVYVLPEEWTVECSECGEITDWRAYTHGSDGSEVPICYDCWERGGYVGWFHDEDELGI